MKTNELTGAALDWMVAKCEGRDFELAESFLSYHDEAQFNYSTDWSQGGPIIAREGIDVFTHVEHGWTASYGDNTGRYGNGFTPLIAAMRCYVTSKLGNEVEIPEELKP